MKTRSIRQRLADRLRGLKPQQPSPQMMAAAGWLVTMSEDKAKARCLEELRDVKAHIKNQFERQVSWLVGLRRRQVSFPFFSVSVSFFNISATLLNLIKYLGNFKNHQTIPGP